MVGIPGTLMRCRLPMRPMIAVLSLTLATARSGQAEDMLVSIGPRPVTGSSTAVLVGDVPLIHTSQLFPDTVDTGDEQQIQSLLSVLKSTLQTAGSGLEQCVKLNVYVVQRKLIPLFHSEMAQQFRGRHKPAVSFIVTALSDLRARVALDAVAVTATAPSSDVRILSTAGGGTDAESRRTVSVIPDGTRIYLSGHGAGHESLEGAARSTLAQIRKTLQFLGRSEKDVLQLRCFLRPVARAQRVRKEITEFFRNRPVPPVSLVECQADPRVPVEIEVVVFGGRNRTGPVLEYLTPPGMTASPVFSHIVRLNHAKSIYISGLYGSAGGKSDMRGVEAEQVFRSLGRVLKESGSDLRHLAKATCAVSSDAAGRALTEICPQVYDPVRPPAVSRVRMNQAGPAGQSLMVDLIAVPAVEPDVSEYGPPESGHGLSLDDAMNGWISLFDGRTSFGWTGASVAGGLISGGRTTSQFQSFEIRADSETAGMLQIGEHAFAVDGKFCGRIDALADSLPQAICSTEGLRLRRLVIRPLKGKALLNRDDLAGWKAIRRDGSPQRPGPKWNLRSGTLHVSGGPGCLEFQDRQYGDFLLQIDVRTRQRHVNAGVFFRAIRGSFMNGYEAQIFNRSSNADPGFPARWCTGGIDDRQNARRMTSRDFRFFRMTVMARGPHIATWVNGYQQVDWTDVRRPHDNPRRGLRLKPGAIQLQAHDPETDVEFRRIVVSSL